jgi:XRE family transcriptional regulator, regulator of sulfur utilization
MPRRIEPQSALGQAIRELRTERGLTQEALASEAEMHPTWISRLESGQHDPAWSTVQRISEALGVSMRELVDRTEAEQH